MEEKNKATFTFTVDNDDFVSFGATGSYKDGVAAELYNILCKAQIEIINWRSKKIKK